MLLYMNMLCIHVKDGRFSYPVATAASLPQLQGWKDRPPALLIHTFPQGSAAANM